MMIIFIVQLACPDIDVMDELLADFRILIIDEGCEIVDVIRWLVEVFYRDWVWITEAN